MIRRSLLLTLFLLAALTAPASAAVTVQDVRVDEGGTATFTVVRSMGDFTVYSADTADDSAKAPGDYAAASTSALDFGALAGGTATFTVTTAQDAAPELDETFKVVLTGGGDAVTATGTITDDDPASATPTDATAKEGDGTAQIAIAVTPTSREAELRYTTQDGTAKAGSDFAAGSGTVKVAPGATAAAIPVTVLDDSDDEDDEAFTLSVTGPDGQARTATVTIPANDARFVSVGDTSVIEGDDQSVVARVPIALNAPTTRTVTVRYGTLDGSARAPRDYLARLGVATFAPGQSQIVVEVPIVGDDVKEGAEAFGLLLGEVKGAQVSRQRGVIAVTDDDAAGSATAGGDARPPRMKLGQARLSTSRSVRMLVACPKGEKRCRGKVTLFVKANRRGKARLLRKERRVAAKAFSLPGDASETVRFVLSASIARAFKQNRRATVAAYLVARDAAGNVVKKSTSTRLRARAK